MRHQTYYTGDYVQISYHSNKISDLDFGPCRSLKVKSNRGTAFIIYDFPLVYGLSSAHIQDAYDFKI